MATDANQRAARVAEAEAIAGIRDGSVYRVRSADGVRWYRVSVAFYPSTRWFVEDLVSPSSEPVPATHRALDDALRAQLETWL